MHSAARTRGKTGRDVKVIDVLDKARAKLEQGFAGSQATKGALLDALGQTYKGLGIYDTAGDRALPGPFGPRRRRSARPPRHAHKPQQPGRRSTGMPAGLAEAIALDEATLKLRTAKLGPDHVDTLKSRNNLALKYVDAGRLKEANRAFRVDAQAVRGQAGARRSPHVHVPSQSGQCLRRRRSPRRWHRASRGQCQDQ